jgi:hypothetical protein
MTATRNHSLRHHSAQRPRRTPVRLKRRWPKPRLTIAQILEWADEFHRQKGRWPHHFDGHIKQAGDDTWARVNDALAHGNRGLPGTSSLARLLFLRRGVRSPRNVPSLTEQQIFSWAKAHFERTRQWPRENCGPVRNAPGETWAGIDLALRRGTRGLPGGSSLASLLDNHGVKRNPQKRPPLTIKKILESADAFHRSHGHWPFRDSGPIEGLPGETWATIDRALSRGLRGLAPGKPLATLLNEHRGIFGGRTRRLPRVRRKARLQLDQIRAWGKAYRRRHGVLPNRNSGPIADSGGLKWSTLDSALKAGNRGLPAGSSLAKLFGDRRNRKRNQHS